MRVSNKKLGMRFDCNRLWNWAQEKLGPSKCEAIAFYWKYGEDVEMGYYDWKNTIWINLAECKRMVTVQKTILHEWTQAQQSYRWWKHYDLNYGYKNNPYEIQARENEKLVKRAYKRKSK